MGILIFYFFFCRKMLKWIYYFELKGWNGNLLWMIYRIPTCGNLLQTLHMMIQCEQNYKMLNYLMVLELEVIVFFFTFFLINFNSLNFTLFFVVVLLHQVYIHVQILDARESVERKNWIHFTKYLQEVMRLLYTIIESYEYYAK